MEELILKIAESTDIEIIKPLLEELQILQTKKKMREYHKQYYANNAETLNNKQKERYKKKTEGKEPGSVGRPRKYFKKPEEEKPIV